MQTRFLSSLMLAVTAMLMFASCSKSNKEGLYIPKNAALVVHLNGASLAEKLPWEEVKKTELFQEAGKDSSVSEFVKQTLENPENTGIDTKKDLLFFMQKDSLGGYAALEGTVKDEAKFKDFGLKAIKNATASEKDGITFVAKEKFTLSWKKDKFILVIDIPEMNEINKYSQFESDDSIPKTAVYRDGIAAATTLYNIKEDESLAKDEKFTELMDTKGDMHFWVNGQSFGSSTAGALGALSMVNLAKITEGSIMAATANFENGKIVADIKSYSGKELSELWKKYSGDKISSDMAKRVPSKDVAAFVALNYKPEGLREFMKLAGLEGLINMGAASIGFTFDDFVKANKGDLLFVVSDIKNDSLTGKDASFLFSTSIGDKASFAKLVDAGKKAGGMDAGLGSKIAFNSNENYFAIGNNKTSVDKYITAESGTPGFFDKISGSPFGGYVNFQYIFNAMKEDAKKDSIENEIFLASAKMWDNLVAKGGEYKNGAVNQHIEVMLVDKNTNSLKQLNSYFATVAALVKKQKEMNSQKWQDMDYYPKADTTTVVTPVPAY